MAACASNSMTNGFGSAMRNAKSRATRRASFSTARSFETSHSAPDACASSRNFWSSRSVHLGSGRSSSSMVAATSVDRRAMRRERGRLVDLHAHELRIVEHVREFARGSARRSALRACALRERRESDAWRGRRTRGCRSTRSNRAPRASARQRRGGIIHSIQSGVYANDRRRRAGEPP